MALAHQHIVTNVQRESLAWRDGKTVATPTGVQYVLCRCGHSGNKPFCDGAHRRVGFDGTEVASRAPNAQQAVDCPGGRLRARARQTAQAQAVGDSVEPHFEPSIGLVQATAKGVSGPLWVRGGVELIGADGQAYEVRNRVALCRCGASANKPFCDGSHVSSGFTDQN